ncbi:MAG: NAD-dependent epimerase/dehydratase family protein [Coriobacteriia bacterium]|nr:NAD-dependent epimerase/dehydratase family protein [Coriobacteriia bacterium]
MSDLHVVFGTGPAGTNTAIALAEKGLRVRAVNRSGKRPAAMPADVEVVAVTDASDAAQATNAAQGASVVYQCLNPNYSKWPELFPPLQRGVVAAARSVGARYVSLENLYGLGRVNGPMTESTPMNPCSKKGATRAAMTEELLELMAAGDLEVATGRAADYYGPGVVDSAMGTMVFEPLLAGKKVSLVGSADVVHSYAYIEDVGRGLATLGTEDRAFGRTWNLPHAPAVTGRATVAHAFKAAGLPEKTGALSPLTIRIGGLFMPVAKESVEMLYEFTEPFVVDSSAIEREFGLKATPLPAGMAKTVAWFKARR